MTTQSRHTSSYNRHHETYGTGKERVKIISDSSHRHLLVQDDSIAHIQWLWKYAFAHNTRYAWLHCVWYGSRRQIFTIGLDHVFWLPHNIM